MNIGDKVKIVLNDRQLDAVVTQLPVAKKGNVEALPLVVMLNSGQGIENPTLVEETKKGAK